MTRAANILLGTCFGLALWTCAVVAKLRRRPFLFVVPRAVSR